MTFKTILRPLPGYFFRGLLLAVPVTVIAYVMYRLFVFLDHLIPTDTPGLGIVTLIVALTLLGWLGSSFIGRPIVRYANALLERVPLLKTIYTAITDLLSAFVGQKKSFSRPVLVRLSTESNLLKPGFITTDQLQALHISGGMVAVYMPHSYNFSGNLFIVPAEAVTPVDANRAEFMKFIVSGGVTEIGLGRQHE
jgi:uncharacterized membrane protein